MNTRCEREAGRQGGRERGQRGRWQIRQVVQDFEANVACSIILLETREWETKMCKRKGKKRLREKESKQTLAQCGVYAIFCMWQLNLWHYPLIIIIINHIFRLVSIFNEVYLGKLTGPAFLTLFDCVCSWSRSLPFLSVCLCRFFTTLKKPSCWKLYAVAATAAN